LRPVKSRIPRVTGDKAPPSRREDLVESGAGPRRGACLIDGAEPSGSAPHGL